MNESEIKRKLCEILGVPATASADEIKKAYAVEVKKWHPDRVQHNAELASLAEQKLKDINQAYECLTDRNQFDRYAAKLAQKHSDSKNAGASSGAASNTSTKSKASNAGDSASAGSQSSSSGAKSSSSASGGSNTGSGATNNGSGTSDSRSGAASSGGSASGAGVGSSGTASPDKAGVVKIFLATGLFVLIVIIVANITAPRNQPQYSPGITLSPSESPGAPLTQPSYPNYRTTSPSDNSIAPPPGSNQ